MSIHTFIPGLYYEWKLSIKLRNHTLKRIFGKLFYFSIAEREGRIAFTQSTTRLRNKTQHILLPTQKGSYNN